MSLRGVLRIAENNRLAFWCPGCKEMHAVRVHPGPDPWGFNGNYDRPTFTPSVLVTGRRFTAEGEAQYQRWARSQENQAPQSFPSEDFRCHFFITSGQIQFLADCSHQLAGKAVPLEAPPT